MFCMETSSRDLCWNFFLVFTDFLQHNGNVNFIYFCPLKIQIEFLWDLKRKCQQKILSLKPFSCKDVLQHKGSNMMHFYLLVSSYMNILAGRSNPWLVSKSFLFEPFFPLLQLRVGWPRGSKGILKVVLHIKYWKQKVVFSLLSIWEKYICRTSRFRLFSSHLSGEKVVNKVLQKLGLFCFSVSFQQRFGINMIVVRCFKKK